MLNIRRIIAILPLAALPLAATAQTDEPQRRSEIKVNRLETVPEYEDEEFQGTVIEHREQKETESYLYQVPYIVMPDADDDADELPVEFGLNDEGATSEDEILLEGFDTAVIHLPKLNPASITEPILLQLGRFTYPTPTTSRPSSHFGPRRRRFHYGLDLAQPTGEPIYAAFDGVVRISKLNKSYGNLVIIHHANGLETYYAHMSKRNVVAGQHVSSGDVIGLCGNTGRSFGSHLHFEIRYMGNAMNPENVIDTKTHDLKEQTLTLTASSFRKVASGGGSSTGKASGDGWYRVRQGDTLEKIARRNGTTVKRLCQLNGISQNKVLHPGDRLRVSGSASNGSTAKNSNSNASTTKNNTAKNGGSTSTAAQQPAQSSGTAATYTVRKGDTLYSIAKRNGTTVNRLCQLNGLSEKSTLRVGQKLKLK